MVTPREANMTMENKPFEDVSPIKNSDYTIESWLFKKDPFFTVFKKT